MANVLEEWKATSSLLSGGASSGASTIIVGKYMYYIAGQNASGTLANVQFSLINEDGSLDGWQWTTSLPKVRTYGKAFTHDGYLFYSGGFDTISVNEEIYRANIDTDGSITAWTQSRDLPYATAFHSIVVSGYCVYLCGGSDASFDSVNYTYYTFIYNGVIYPWVRIANLNTAKRSHASLVSSYRYIYALAGIVYDGGSAEYAKIQSTGDLSTWAVEGDNTPGIIGDAVIDSNDNIFFPKYGTSKIYRAPAEIYGTIGAWEEDLVAPFTSIGQIVYDAGYVYILKGSVYYSFTIGYVTPVIPEEVVDDIIVMEESRKESSKEKRQDSKSKYKGKIIGNNEKVMNYNNPLKYLE